MNFVKNEALKNVNFVKNETWENVDFVENEVFKLSDELGIFVPVCYFLIPRLNWLKLRLIDVSPKCHKYLPK